MRTGRKNNNGGYSIVEMIIIITILAIVTGGTVTGFQIYTRAKEKKCVQTTLNAIGQAKVATMAKDEGSGNSYFEMYEDAEGYVHADVVINGEKSDDNCKIVADPAMKVYFNTSEGAEGLGITGVDKSIRCYFDRSTGRVITNADDEGRALYGDHPLFTQVWTGSSNTYENAVWKLTLVPVTGKCYMGDKKVVY